MSWIKRVGEELLGLFVDDGSFALAILVWVGLWLLALRQHGANRWAGWLLWLGMALLLVGSTVRFARQKLALKQEEKGKVARS